ncbi:hypothetical protein [Cysteiniphilum sp. 6C5]|uniref:hypothetical protein n=1 Tax=unclassified Cysteiniphilum TaxID=2610889 RepID=UPI003F863718
MIQTKFEGKYLYINDKKIQLPYVIREAFERENKVIVLFDSDLSTNPTQPKKFHNLVAYDLNGNELWKAELPIHDAYGEVQELDWDDYWGVWNMDSLKASSSSSYRCTIDSKTGKIINKIYYK